MTRGWTIFLIIVVVLALAGAAYYFLIYKKEQELRLEDGTNSNGTQSGTSSTPPQITSLKVGDSVYLNSDKSIWAGANGATGIPVYNNSITDSQGSFLEGVTRADWMPGWNIGTVLEIKQGWVKVRLNNFQIWKFNVGTGYTTNIAKLTGDYWFSDQAVKKL